MKNAFVGILATGFVIGLTSCQAGAVRSWGTPDYQNVTGTHLDQPVSTYSYSESRPLYSAVKTDNSKFNERIVNNSEWTAEDQGSSDRDIRTTQEIRKQVVDQDSFSSSAKNVKVITRNGSVVLKGPVKSLAEKQRIEAIAKKVAGVPNVINVITVVQ